VSVDEEIKWKQKEKNVIKKGYEKKGEIKILYT
jgi:hypothetical protein